MGGPTLGAYDFLGKPVQLDDLRLVLKRCFHVALLEREYQDMRQRLEKDAFEGMIGAPERARVALERGARSFRAKLTHYRSILWSPTRRQVAT